MVRKVDQRRKADYIYILKKNTEFYSPYICDFRLGRKSSHCNDVDNALQTKVVIVSVVFSVVLPVDNRAIIQLTERG